MLLEDLKFRKTKSSEIWSREIHLRVKSRE